MKTASKLIAPELGIEATAHVNSMDNIPAAACPRCGGWTNFGGCSQHSESDIPVMGRTGCTCHRLPKQPAQAPAPVLETYTRYELHIKDEDLNGWRKVRSKRTEELGSALKDFRDYIVEQRKSNAKLRGFIPVELCRDNNTYRVARCSVTVIEPKFKP